MIARLNSIDCLLHAEAMIAILRDSGDYDDNMCNRIQTVLTAPHKHKGREARKTKELGTYSCKISRNFASMKISWKFFTETVIENFIISR